MLEVEKNQYIRRKRRVQVKKDSQAHGVNMRTYPLTGTVREHALKRDVIHSKDAAFFIAPLQKQNLPASLSTMALWSGSGGAHLLTACPWLTQLQQTLRF